MTHFNPFSPDQAKLMQCNKYYCNATNSPPHCQIPAVARHFVPSPLACGVYLDLEQAPFHPPEPEAPQRREPAPAGRAAKENDQPGFAGWRRAWRFHLGSARPDSGRRTARGRRHLRQLGRRTECGDARRRACARRAAGGAAPSCRFLARRELRRQPAGLAARRRSSGCCRSCRASMRRCRGSGCRRFGRPTISTRSTSIRSRI